MASETQRKYPSGVARQVLADAISAAGSQRSDHRGVLPQGIGEPGEFYRWRHFPSASCTALAQPQ